MIQELLSNTTTLKFSPIVRICNFTPLQKAEASTFSEQVYQECFDTGSFTVDEMKVFLSEQGIWTEQDEEMNSVGLEELQLMKVDYFDSFALASKKERIKKSIQKKLGLLNEQFMNKNYLHEYTCEYAKEESYGIHLFIDTHAPVSFYRKFAAARLPEDSIRGLYFDNTWRMIWSVSKDAQSIFGGHLNSLNDNQLSLLYWSKLYDNIQESMEAPSSNVLKDPLAVDGWLIKQSKKRESEDRQKLLPENNAGEVFVPVKNKREAKEVMSLNSIEGRQVLKSRARDIIAKGDLDESQFSHVKRDLGIKKNELSFGGSK